MDARSMLLGFLMHSPMTGYELKKKFSISFSFFSGLSYGSIYPALKKMEREGLIHMKREIRTGSPNRNVYTITDAGRETFVETLRSPFALVQPKNAFLARLFFFGYLRPEERLASAREHLETVRQVQGQIRSIQPQIKGHADKYQYLCYRFGVQFYEDLTRNVSRIVRELEKETNHLFKSEARRRT
jgi:DNA-binding PadR family transcriptional regulator